jgi:PGF-pre-PGF domain-containing protein
VVLTNIKSNQEINSPISVEGIYLTKLILESSKNISYASLKITVLDSDSISGLSSNNIYQGFQINKTGITNENINSVSLEFKVGKSWVDERNVSKIVLKRKQENSSEWEMLNTTLIGNDSTYYYFKSISSGFSLFAIYFDETLCIPEELFCSGNDLKLCSADRTSSVVEVCEYGCSEGKCLAQEELEQSEEFTFDVRTFFRNNLSIIFFVVIAMILLALIVVTFVLFKHVKKRR